MQRQEQKPGTLYGIGVGPGDPELIPLKSIRILKKVDLIFTAASTKNTHSLAVQIAERYIPPKTRICKLHFPMTKNRKEAEKYWQEHALKVIAALKQGQDAAFLTLGDPLTYSTYGYLLRQVQKLSPEIPIKTIPGITSYQAGAAVTNTPLVEGEESMLLVSGVPGGAKLRQFSSQVENIVFLKAYKNIDDIIVSLEENERCSSSIGLVRCTFPEQEIIQDVKTFKGAKPKYWTLIISKKPCGQK